MRALCVAQCVGLGVALSISRPPVADPFAWLAVLIQLLLLILFVSIGSLVGRLTQPLLAGLLASSLVLLLVYFFGSPSKQVTILHTGLATLPRVGYRYHWTFLAAQALIIIALIVATWLLRPVAPATSRSIPVTRWFAAVVLAIGVVGAGLVSTVDRLVPTGRPPTHCGAVEAIPVCFYPEHARVETAFNETLWVIVDSTEASEYRDILPDAFAETSRTWSPTDATTAPLTISDEQLTGSPPDVGAILQGVVEPLHCPQLQTDVPPSERYGTDLQRLVATWMRVVTGQGAGEGDLQDGVLAPARALELRDQFASCTYPYFTNP